MDALRLRRTNRPAFPPRPDLPRNNHNPGSPAQPGKLDPEGGGRCRRLARSGHSDAVRHRIAMVCLRAKHTAGYSGESVYN
ncbi:hypothetical protein N656DRAFT_784955 [Canariomyces notabilis]|uniref:Uncharacterized protein n=1 Tax=Canariomyces notabilis TaxID=2074819 RepID=A0AAN6QCQ1_9PEZI|nr:hypothetical protein N656DRAFT_784955 [Canariomyces arenarius]